MVPSDSPVALLFALGDELRAGRAILNRSRRARIDGVRYTEGEVAGVPAVLLQTGPGRERARAVAQFAIARFQPRALIMAGYAGGLQPGLGTGAVVVANPVFEPQSGREAFPPETLLQRARQASEDVGGVHFGRLVTVDRVLGSPAEKARAYEATAALAADMESLGALKAANVNDTPFVAVRVVVDDTDTELPPNLISMLDENGNVRLLKAALEILKRPGTLAALPALKRRTDRARESLTAYLRALVGRLDDFEPDDGPSDRTRRT